MIKGPQSPTAASVADTVATATTPVAATDENVSVADRDEASNHRRRSSRGASNILYIEQRLTFDMALAHKRKASEMDVDLPPPTLKVRPRSPTAEEERELLIGCYQTLLRGAMVCTHTLTPSFPFLSYDACSGRQRTGKSH
jgi:hypothetical protein